MKSWIGKKPVTEMAKLLGTSVANIKRGLRGTSIWFHNGKYKNRPELVAQVLRYYAEHGKIATVERFPDVNVKCIVDRPEYYGLEKPKRQVRWTDREIHEAAKMAGLISPQGQAKYFNRPNAFNGSIKSLWVKKFKLAGGSINGMPYWTAQHLVDSSTQYLKAKGCGRKGESVNFRWLALWIDMENSLRPEVPPFIREAIHTMANFQRWLWKSKNPKPLILKMIQEREVA